DKLLQGRLFSYGDAHRYRVGTNHNQLPINQPKCPMHNHQRDGSMAINNYDSTVNYEPNTVDAYQELKHERETREIKSSNIGYFEQDNDFYTQPGLFINLLRKTPKEYEDLVKNISSNLKPVSKHLKEKVLEHFNKIDEEFSKDVSSLIN
ncbi:MAG: catalase, partial [Mycoplasma sp.]